MEKSAEPVAALEITPPPPPVVEDAPHIFNRLLKVIAYPIAAISGVWVTAREVHFSAYEKAKRVEGNPLFGEAKRLYIPQYKKNAEDLVKGIVSQEEFLAHELVIKAAHSKAVAERMESMGLGQKWFGLKDLPAKWSYINRQNRANAIIQGLTVSGIAIGALLTIANTRSLIDAFSNEKDSDTETKTR